MGSALQVETVRTALRAHIDSSEVPMTTLRIRRHFVTVGPRRVHYRRAGSGPPLILLHASPTSSQAMRAHILALAVRFTVIALDTPGYGRSDPLPLEAPDIEDYADALADTLKALAIPRALVFGRHTGACIAMSLAARAADLVEAVWVDGYPVLDAAARARYLGDYLQTVSPRWDGTHLLWYWFRFREQFVHWPWNEQLRANRADVDVPDLQSLHRGAMDMMLAGKRYITAYAAAFRFDSLAVLPAVRCPVYFAARPGDSLYKAVQALPSLPETMQVVAVPREHAAALALVEELLLAHAPGLAPAPAPPPSRSGPDYIDTDAGEIAIQRGGDGSGRPWLLLAPAPGSAALLQVPDKGCGAPSQWVSIDLPGHGCSSHLPDNKHALDTCAETVEQVAAALGIEAPILFGSQAGAAVALEVALRKRIHSPALCLDDLPLPAPAVRSRWLEMLAVDASPSWEGAHLLRVWHQQRDLALWWPGDAGRRKAIRPSGPALDTAPLQARVVEMLRRPEAYAAGWRLTLGEELKWRVDVLAPPLLLVSRDDAVFGRADAALADRAAAGGRIVLAAPNETALETAVKNIKTIS